MILGMKPILLMLLASLASAQQGKDARALLNRVVDTARTTKSWRAEFTGIDEQRSDKVSHLIQVSLKMTLQGPYYAHIEGSDGGVVLTCDGVTAWRYHPSLNNFANIPVARYRSCLGFVPAWTNLLDGLRSAAIVGRDAVQFQGALTPCEVVRVEYTRWLNFRTGTVVAPAVRTLCIDAGRALILRDEVVYSYTAVDYPGPGDSSVVKRKTTTTYSTIERNPNLPPSTFRFDPPPNSTVFSMYPLPDYYLKGEPPAESGLDTMPAWVLRTGAGVLAPAAISKVAPEYTEEARQARIQGKVTMLVWVSSEGIPELMRITHSLDPGLDWKAIEAVRSWRFTPGQKDGKPVYTAISMDVDFRLP
jgi:TonB family protein